MVLNLFKSVSLRGLFVALFLMPSLAQAGLIWKALDSNSTWHLATSPEAACDAVEAVSAAGDLYPANINPPSDTSGQCVNDASTFYKSLKLSDQTCPAGTEVDANNYCVEVSPCPLAGTSYYTSELMIIVGSNSATTNYGGCEYEYDGSTACWYSLAESDIICGTRMTATGNTVLGDGADPNILEEGANPPPANSTEHFSTDSTSTYTQTPPVVDTLPDNTVVTTEQSTSTSTAGDTTTIDNSQDDVVVTEQKGSSTTTNETVVTTSNPDGSFEVETNTTNSYTPPETTTTTLDKDSDSVTSTESGGDTVINDYSTTNYYDSDGQLTDSETTQTSDGTGEDEPCTGEDCGDGSQYSMPDRQGSFDDANSQVSSDIAQAKTDLQTTFNSIKTEASTLVTFTGSGTGSLPCPPPVQMQPFGEFSLCLTDYQDELSLVGVILVFIASFLALAIILR